MIRTEMNAQRYSNPRTLRRFKNKILKKYQEDCSRIYSDFTYCSTFERALNIERQKESILNKYKDTFINMAQYINIVRLFLLDKDMFNVFDFYPNITSNLEISFLRTFKFYLDNKALGKEYDTLIKELIFVHNIPRFPDYDLDEELKAMFDSRELNYKLENELENKEEKFTKRDKI